MRANALALAAVLVAGLGLVPSGNAIDVTASLLPSAPSVTSITILTDVSSGVTPSVSGTATLSITVVVTDLNGPDDLASLSVKLLRPDASTLQTFTIAQPPDSTGLVTATYTARSVTVPFYALPAAGYKLQAQATDDGSLLSSLLDASSLTSAFTVNTVLGLSAPASVDLDGAGLAPGAAGSIQTVSIGNGGNVVLDVAYSTAGLSGPGGATIPGSAFSVGLDSGLADGQALSASRELESDIAVGAATSGNTYMRLTMPQGLVDGTYTGSVTATAVQS